MNSDAEREVPVLLSIDEDDEMEEGEIREIEDGRIDAENNPLKNAPHTMEDLVRDWDRPYSREQGCFPPGAFRVEKKGDFR